MNVKITIRIVERALGRIIGSGKEAGREYAVLKTVISEWAHARQALKERSINVRNLQRSRARIKVLANQLDKLRDEHAGITHTNRTKICCKHKVGCRNYTSDDTRTIVRPALPPIGPHDIGSQNRSGTGYATPGFDVDEQLDP